MQVSAVLRLSSQCSASLLSFSIFAPRGAGSALDSCALRGASVARTSQKGSLGFRVISSDNGPNSGLRVTAKALKLHRPRLVDEKMRKFPPVTATGGDFSDEVQF